jgi:hypothetical protein
MNEVEKTEAEIEELGVVSEDTHGGFIGYYWDGGFGKRI